MADNVIPFKETKYGFEWGGLTVNRITDDPRKGWVVLGLETPKHNVQVYATKTGKIRVWLDGKEQLPQSGAAVECGP